MTFLGLAILIVHKFHEITKETKFIFKKIYQNSLERRKKYNIHFIIFFSLSFSLYFSKYTYQLPNFQLPFLTNIQIKRKNTKELTQKYI